MNRVDRPDSRVPASVPSSVYGEARQATGGECGVPGRVSDADFHIAAPRMRKRGQHTHTTSI